MMWKLRERLHINQEDLAKGILSAADLSRVEHGTKEIDYFELEALFQRMGKSLDKLELVLSRKEYQLLCIREKIEEALEKNQYEEVDSLLDEYMAYNSAKRNMHQQYSRIVKGILQYLREKNGHDVLTKLDACLEITCENWKETEWAQLCLCTQEVRILLLIAYIKVEAKEYDSALQMLLNMQEYLEIRYTDEEEKAKIYPHCMYLLATTYWQQGEIETAYKKCWQGIECLVDNGALTLLSELLQLQKDCLEKMGKKVEQEKCKQYIEAIDFVYELAQKERCQEMILLLLKESVQRECIISNELIREMRKATSMTQEKLSDNICAQETLARIEKDKTNPNSKNMYDMLKRMGMSREKYYGFIISDDYELYEKVRLYIRCVGKEEKEKAYELLNEIESELDMKEHVNRQFVESGRIGQRLWKQKITYKQAIDELEKVLHWTMPPIKDKERVYRMPFRKEFMILNQIALFYKRSGQVDAAVDICKQIEEKYDKGILRMYFHSVPASVLYTNYCGFLEVQDNLQEALIVAQRGIEHAVLCNRADLVGLILANVYCVYEKKHQPELEERYLRSACILVDLYKRKKDKIKFEKVYREKFKKVNCFLQLHLD